MHSTGSTSQVTFFCCVIVLSVGLSTLRTSLAQEELLSPWNLSDNDNYREALLLAKLQVACLSSDDEILPVFDEKSLTTKPSACRSPECVHCLKCVSTSMDPTERALCRNYSYPETSMKTDLTYLTEDSPHPPSPSFHCTSHYGEKFITYFKIEYSNSSYMSTIDKDLIPRLFIVEKETDGGWEVVHAPQKFWILPLQTKLQSTYRIRVTAISPVAIYKPQISIPIQIHDVSSIGKPWNLRLIDTDVKDATRPNAKALIRWDSSSGTNASCDYDVYYMDDDMHNIEIKKAENAFYVTLSELTLGRNYTVNVIEKFGKQQSGPASLHLIVPPCLFFYNNNYQRCPPPSPTNVRIENETSTTLWVSWSPPMYSSETNRIIEYHLTADVFFKPDGSISESARLFSDKIPGPLNVTKARVNNTFGLSGRLRVSLTARSAGGESKEVVAWFHMNTKAVSSFTTRTWIVVGVLAALIFLVGSFFVIKSFRSKLQRQRKRHEYFENLEKETMMTPIVPDRYSTKWEIDLGNLEVGDVIGEGFFGLVRKAILHRNGESIVVAVKTMRDSVETKDADKFWEEFEILKGLGRHGHVVGLVGIVQKHVPALIVEYCDGGDLQTHLRKIHHSQVNDLVFSSDLPSFGSNSENFMVTNEAYFARDVEEILGPVDLLSYARQIACGMEFLSLNKIVHRDLAARNILVSGQNRTLKIADFGLSRDVYEQNWYKKSSKGKIPFKWLAVECLLQEVYTTQSDVWSYGILLWEIVTFGGIPYPGIENTRIFDMLKAGYRMSKPANCSDELYALMKNCWAEKPSNRPDFPTIRHRLENMIEQISGTAYFAVESNSSL